MSEFTTGIARNIADNARSQVERTWGENPKARLGGLLYNGQVAQHALLALTGYVGTDRLTDAEVRQLVLALWEELKERK